MYSVDRTQNGRSFAIRTVRSCQLGALLFVLTASFHKSQPSTLTHAMPSPIELIPAPESIETSSSHDHNIFEKPQLSGPDYSGFPTVDIDFRYVDEKLRPTMCRNQSTDYRQYIWFRVNGSISNDRRINAIALAYTSDHAFRIATNPVRQKASNMGLAVHDHAIYFHDVCPSKT